MYVNELRNTCHLFFPPSSRRRGTRRCCFFFCILHRYKYIAQAVNRRVSTRSRLLYYICIFRELYTVDHIMRAFIIDEVHNNGPLQWRSSRSAVKRAEKAWRRNFRDDWFFGYRNRARCVYRGYKSAFSLFRKRRRWQKDEANESLECPLLYILFRNFTTQEIAAMEHSWNVYCLRAPKEVEAASALSSLTLANRRGFNENRSIRRKIALPREWLT